MAQDRQAPRQHPWEHEGQGEQVSFGTWLRRQREVRQITLREIAEVTKISVRYLEALEQDRFDILPAPVFAKGFLREYARYVGLDGDEVVNSYLTADRRADEEDETKPRVEKPPSHSARDWTSGILLTLAVAALLALIAFLAFYAERSRRQPEIDRPSIAAPVSRETVAPLPPPPAAEPVSDAPLRITMDFIENCWLEIAVDDERRLSRLYVQGESLQLEAQERVLLTIGNPEGVRIEVNGEPFTFAYSPGRVARDILIELGPESGEPGGG